MHQDHQELLEQVARDLSNLTFWNDGFKSALKQIEESKRPRVRTRLSQSQYANMATKHSAERKLRASLS
jgi:hypothetical protein